MRSETIAIHGGYEVDPMTRAVAVPIYQTVAYALTAPSTEPRSSISRSRISIQPHRQPDQCVLERVSPRWKEGWSA